MSPHSLHFCVLRVHGCPTNPASTNCLFLLETSPRSNLKFHPYGLVLWRSHSSLRPCCNFPRVISTYGTKPPPWRRTFSSWMYCLTWSVIVLHHGAFPIPFTHFRSLHLSAFSTFFHHCDNINLCCRILFYFYKMFEKKLF